MKTLIEEKEKLIAELIITNKELIIAKEKVEESEHRLKNINEEYETTNEELISTNEELNVTNEELFELKETLEERVKQRTIALQKSEERYRSTLDNMMEGCQILNYDWLYLYINAAAEKHNKRPKEELLGKKYMDMWPGIKDTKVFAIIKKCIEERVSYSMDNEFTFPNGTKGWFELRIEPIPEGVFILSTDITERKKSEFELIIANKELIFQNEEKEKRAAELIIANNELTYQNREKEKRADELILANKELAFQNEEKEKRAAELIIINKDLRKAKEEIFELNTSLEEKVEKRTEELEIAIKTKDKFFSIIAHDLKNPFAGLLSSCELLKRSIIKQDMNKIEKFTESIYCSSKHAYSLLKNLLEWASLQLGKIEVKKEEFNICDLITDALTSVQNIATEKEIEIINCDVKNCNVIFDKEMFKALIRNLTTNAIKFSNKGSKVFIEVLDFDEKYLKVNVKDLGIGITKEGIEKLFRIDVSHTSYGTNNEKGTGLGLLLCKDFAIKNGTDLLVESEVDKGSTFSFGVERVLGLN